MNSRKRMVKAMAKIAKQLTELIGNTPLLELTKYEKENELEANLIVKLEYFNPLGSVKDRVAYAMIEQGIADGKINSDTVIIEPTSGNTGIGGMAGGIGAFIINKGSGILFDYADQTQMVFMGFKGEEAGYFIIFSVCAFSHLIGWVVMKALVPRYKPITDL